jgi:hypothetical protein
MLQAATSSTIEAPTVEAPVPTLIAAAQGEATTTELDGEEQVEVIVTRDNGDLPPDCGPRAVAAILLRFVDSWNYGDQAELAQLIAARSGIRGEGFQWYSVTEGDPRNGGRYFVTYRPEGVLEYAAERHVHGERLRIMAVDVGGGGNLGFSLARQADDPEPGLETFAQGKGVVDCDTGRIRVWSMGLDPNSSLPALPLGPCPEPATRADADAVVACTRT